MVARRKCTNCVYARRDRPGHYNPISAACYIAKGRTHENQTHCGPVFGWALFSALWRGRAAPRGEGDREARQIFKRTPPILPEGVPAACLTGNGTPLVDT